MSSIVRPFDLSALLDSDAAIAEYLSQVLADGDSDELIRALGHVAKAKGMTSVAQATGLGRESLYKTLMPGAKPRFETIVRVMQALGMSLTAMPSGALQGGRQGESQPAIRAHA